MRITPATPLRVVAVHVPGAARVLEGFHLDFCCRGATTLGDACGEAQVDLFSVMRALEAGVHAQAEPADSVWGSATLDRLVHHIVTRHHTFATDALATVAPLCQRVIARHAPAHPELLEVARLSSALRVELLPHLELEERVLFPRVVALERGDGAPQHALADTLGTLSSDHRGVGDLVLSLRAATAGFQPPPDACASWVALYAGLGALEADLHRHIHLEENLLFPRALALAQR